MKIKVLGRNIEVTDALRSSIEKKLSRLDKYFRDEGPVEAQVTLQVEKERHIVEVTLLVNGLILRGEEETGDMYASIDTVVDKLDRQIHKYKTRVNRKMREVGSNPVFADAVDEQGDDDDEYPKIVRTKRFAVKPMSAEEAVLQMELLGHNFFVFRDAETEDVSVVYKRRDGNYGLIEPEY